MSGSITPSGPGMGSAYSLDALPVQIDPVTGVPIVPQAAPDLPQWAGGTAPSTQAPQAPSPTPPPAPPQVSPPPASLPFSGPSISPADLAPPTPPGAQAAPAAASPAPTPAPQPASAPTPVPVTSPPGVEGISDNDRHNPLNLRFAGQDGATDANGFAAFATQDDGIAAAKRQFALDASRGINTLSGLISSWAPPAENDTAGYIKKVAAATGIAPDAKIDLTDPAIQAKIIPAMSVMENGAKGKVGSSQTVSPQGDTSAPPIQPPTQAYLAAQGFPGVNPDAYVGGPGDKLLAIGSGLAGASSLGRGFAAAGQNLLQLGQQNRADQMKAAQFGLENQRLTQQMGFQNAQFQNTMAHQNSQLGLERQRLQTAMAPKPFGTPQKGPDGTWMQPMRDGTGNVSYVPVQGETTQQQRIDLQRNAQSGQPKLIQTAIADNQKRANEIDTEGEAAISQLPQLADFHNLLNSGQTGAGATAVDKFKRYVAEKLGIPIGDTTPSSAQTADLLSKGLINGQISSQMRGLGLRSNNEFNSFKEGMAGLDKNPDALNIMLGNLQKGQEYNKNVYYQWHSPDTEAQREKLMLTPGGLSNWEAPLMKQYAASRGIDPSGPTTSTISQDASGAWKPTTTSLPGGGQITIQRVQ